MLVFGVSLNLRKNNLKRLKLPRNPIVLVHRPVINLPLVTLKRPVILTQILAKY